MRPSKALDVMADAILVVIVALVAAGAIVRAVVGCGA